VLGFAAWLLENSPVDCDDYRVCCNDEGRVRERLRISLTHCFVDRDAFHMRCLGDVFEGAEGAFRQIFGLGGRNDFEVDNADLCKQLFPTRTRRCENYSLAFQCLEDRNVEGKDS